MTSPESKLLVVLINGQVAGTVTEATNGQLTLHYDDRWRNRPTATPVSLSMPLTQPSHPDHVVRAYLWGLLPDSEQVLDRWGRAHHVSARNPFALLRYVGEDCAGAAQFVQPGRVEALLAGEGGVESIDEAEIADRLRTLRRDPAAWHTARSGQFSLAGAQAKTALHYDAQSKRWGDPWGVVPTTHILKPAIAGFDDHDLNEHLSLQTARRLGLDAALSNVVAFADERAIVIERYDRARGADARVFRIHQEDMCQALGLAPTATYENEGGPTPAQIIALLNRSILPAKIAARDIDHFVDALAFNWIVGGTDAHAKNYSVLLAQAQVRLAPIYDVASALPYDMYAPKLRMAMRIGGECRLEAISGRHWRRFAETNRLDAQAVTARIRDLASHTPDALAAAIKTAAVQELHSELPSRLLDHVAARARRCQGMLAEGS